MKELLKILLTSAFLLIGMIAKAQTATDSLLCQEWKLVSYEEGGQKMLAQKDQANDRMIFYLDHKVKSIEGKLIEYGIWQYDATQKKLTVIDNATKEKMVFKLIKVDSHSLVVEMKDRDGVVLRLNMVSVK